MEYIEYGWFLKDNIWSDKINFSLIRENYLKKLSEHDGNVLFSDYNDLKKSIVDSLKD